jgi:hypothetical protein
MTAPATATATRLTTAPVPALACPCCRCTDFDTHTCTSCHGRGGFVLADMDELDPCQRCESVGHFYDCGGCGEVFVKTADGRLQNA